MHCRKKLKPRGHALMPMLSGAEQCLFEIRSVDRRYSITEMAEERLIALCQKCGLQKLFLHLDITFYQLLN